MILSHELQFIFIKTMKTAGSSLELSLSAYCGPLDILTPLTIEEEGSRQGRRPGNYVRTPEMPHRRRRDGLLIPEKPVDFYNHMKADRLRDYVGEGVWNRYLKVAFVRNPWDRAVSAFHWRMRKQPETVPDAFRLFLSGDDGARNPLWKTISLDDRLAVDFVGRYETLDADYARLLQRLKIPDPAPLARAKTTARPRQTRDYRSFYDAETRDQIARESAREIEVFGYEF